MIRIQRTSNDVEKEIDRLADGPTLADLLKFEAVLIKQFQATQTAVHVVTQSLKLSGRIASSMNNNKWSGDIIYGGPSEGIHNPVDYAEYERERDGPHDFLAPAEALSDEYIKAMESFLGG
jgi:hypothetical protein